MRMRMRVIERDSERKFIVARIQQSIDIKVPVRVAYNQLTQFEEYPRFMETIANVRQLDGTHLHWTGTTVGRNIEWDAEITEQQPDKCIAWRNVSGPHSAGKVEVEPLGQEYARVTLTMECEPETLFASRPGDAEMAIRRQLEQDLARFKSFIEARGKVHEGQAVRGAGDSAGRDTDGDAIGKAIGQTAAEKRDGRSTAAPAQGDAGPPARSAGYAAGSEGGDFGDDAELLKAPPQETRQQPSTPAPRYQEQASLPFGSPQQQAAQQAAQQPTQSESSLSQSEEDDDGRFSIAAEQNFDQQSDQARQVGHMPDASPGADPAGAMAASLRKETGGTNDKDAPKKSIERAVPPSDEPSPPEAPGRPGGRRDA
jgi:uncharacterized membrane protein